METLATIRPENLVMSAEQLRALMPALILTVGACLSVLVCLLPGSMGKWATYAVTLAAAVLAGVWSIDLLGGAPVLLFGRSMVADGYSAFFTAVFCGCAVFTILSSFRYLDREGLQYPEYYALVLFSLIGMVFMVQALDLLSLFIALELMSLSVYMLVGFRRADRKSNEASMKYFILGGAASAIMLYGAALLYGATGTTQIREIFDFYQTSRASLPILFQVGSWLMMVGFLFKVASVPFHMWMPDVYEGAPSPVTGFMTTGLKAAAFASFVRVFYSLGLSDISASSKLVHDVLWVIAVLTMVVGNVIALRQNNLKRMLAYSSIAHTGYLMVGLVGGGQPTEHFGPIAVYLVSYSVMNLGAFGILSILASRGDQGLNVHDLSGLGKRHPWLSFALAVFMFSMAGVPPTAGFIAKYLLFYGAIQAGEPVLVVIAVLCSAVSVYYYLRILVAMYMREPVGSAANLRVSLGAGGAVAATVWLTFQIGILPERLILMAQEIARGL